MKDAIGSSILFYLILILLAVFIVLIAVIMNYAMAYRANLFVITRIEATDASITKGSKDNDTAGTNTIYGDLKARNYYGDVTICCSNIGNSNNILGSIYKVKTEVDFNIPLLNVSLKIPIRNETKTIFDVTCENTNNNYDGNCK